MKLNRQQIRQLQQLQSDPRWDALELALQEYLNENFVQSSVKRDNEFNTIWELAFAEGGKMHLQRFFKIIEEECINTYD